MYQTRVIRCPRGLALNVPHLEYNFTPLENFSTVNSNEWIDVLGVVIYVSDHEDVSNSGRLKRDFCISDESGKVVNCVLWESHMKELANDFFYDMFDEGYEITGNVLYINSNEQQQEMLHKIVAVKQGLVRTFNGQKYLWIVAASTFDIEPRYGVRVDKLRTWFSRNKSLFRNFVPPREQNPIDSLTFRQAREKLKNSSDQRVAGNHRELIFENPTCTVVGVKRMDSYTACRGCKTKMELSAGNYCSKCSKFETSPEEHHYSWVSIFNLFISI